MTINTILAHPGHIEHDVPIVLASPMVVGLLIALALLLIAAIGVFTVVNGRRRKSARVRYRQ